MLWFVLKILLLQLPSYTLIRKDFLRCSKNFKSGVLSAKCEGNKMPSTMILPKKDILIHLRDNCNGYCQRTSMLSD